MVSPVLSSSTGAVKACSVESDAAAFSVCSPTWLLFSGSSGGFARLRRVIGIGDCSLRSSVYCVRKEHYTTAQLESLRTNYKWVCMTFLYTTSMQQTRYCTQKRHTQSL